MVPERDIEIPPGTIVPWLGNPASLSQGATRGAPAGWLVCDGSIVSRATYAALYAAIGVMYGAGDGTSTFHLPGAFDEVAHGVATVTPNVALSARAGNSTHNHTYNTATNLNGSAGTTATMGHAGHHAHTVNAPTQNGSNWDHEHVPNLQNTGGPSSNFVGFSGNANLLATDNHTHAFGTHNFRNDHVHTHLTNVGATGDDTTHGHAAATISISGTATSVATLPPFVALWHLIKT